MGVSQRQLDRDWDFICVEHDLRDDSVKVYRMHRFAKRNGHGGDINTQPYHHPAPVNWDRVGQEVRRLLDLGTPKFLNEYSEIMKDKN